LTEKQIRASFVNATRREVAQATMPDLSALDWSSLDYLGWRDSKAPLSAYALLAVDETPTGILLRASDGDRARRPQVGLRLAPTWNRSASRSSNGASLNSASDAPSSSPRSCRLPTPGR
jgi:FBP C-terminal treble-clef zinc-finger